MNYRFKFWLNLANAMIKQHLIEGSGREIVYESIQGGRYSLEISNHHSELTSTNYRYVWHDHHNHHSIYYTTRDSKEGMITELSAIVCNGVHIDLEDIKDYNFGLVVLRDNCKPFVEFMETIWFD